MGIKLMNATVYVYDEKKPNYVLASIRINDVKWKYNSTTKQLSLLTEILILQRKLLILY